MSVAKSSFLFAAGTFLSRISGLARDMVMVGIFGASALLDAFLVAFRIPNLMREMLAEGALANAFTKVYTSIMETDEQRAHRLLADCLWFFSFFSCLVCALGIIFAPWLVQLMTLQVSHAERGEFIHNTIGLTRLLFPYLGLMIVSSVVMGALHQRGRFFLTAFAPVAFNMGFIFGAWLLSGAFVRWNPPWMYPLFGDPQIVGLAVGVLIGGIAQLVMQASALVKSVFRNIPVRLKSWLWNEDMRRVIKLMLPATIAASAGPINIFVNTNFATALGDGAVSWLNFSFRLLQLPIGLFGVAVGVAVLPALSRALKDPLQGVTVEASRYLQQAIELVSWLMLMCFAFLVINHQAMIELLFQHGLFGEADKIATSQALLAYSFGVLGYGLIKVLTSFYYAVERTSFAMKVAIFSIIVNFIGNYLLVQRFGHVGLALTSAVTLSINALILGLGLIPFKVAFDKLALRRSLFFLGAALVLAILTMGFASQLRQFFPADLPLKLEAGIMLTMNATLLMLCFVSMAAFYLRVTPGDIYRRLLAYLPAAK